MKAQKICMPEDMKNYILSDDFYMFCNDPKEKEWAKKAIKYIEDGKLWYASPDILKFQQVKRREYIDFSKCSTIDAMIGVLHDLKTKGYSDIEYERGYDEGDFIYVYKLGKENKQEYSNRVGKRIQDVIRSLKYEENTKKLEKVKSLENQIKEIKDSLY